MPSAQGLLGGCAALCEPGSAAVAPGVGCGRLVACSAPEALRVGARGRATVRPALHQGRTGASGPSRWRPFSGRRCGRTRRSGSAMEPAGSARAAERSPVSAPGPARLRGVEVGRREPVGSARAGLQRTQSGAEPTEQPASAGARVPPHQARRQGGSGE